MSPDRPIAEDDLHAYVDGRLDPARIGDVDAYLREHPDVAARVAGHAHLRGALRDALRPYAEEPIPPELNLATLIAHRRRPRFVAWRSMAACLLCLVVGSGGGWLAHSAAEAPRNGLAALVSEASDSYRVFASDKARPVEIKASEEDQLRKWVSNRLHHPVRIPDLAKSGYRFMGGRLVSTPNGPAGLFLYDDDNGLRLALLARPVEHETTGAITEGKSDAMHGFSWVKDGLGYSLVGPDAASGLHPLADEIRRQMSEPA